MDERRNALRVRVHSDRMDVSGFGTMIGGVRMSIAFRMEVEDMQFYDPTQDWALFSRKAEVRFDPLTGQSTRILYYPIGEIPQPNHAQMAADTKGSCPFCPDKVEQVTPRFPEAITPNGRFHRGQSVIFPNMFPYDRHSAVGIFSGDHYVPLSGFTKPLLTDGFINAQDYLQAVLAYEPDSRWQSINTNYMPMAGGSIIHPHLQIVASPEATNYQRASFAAAQLYQDANGSNYYRDLIAEEERRQERAVGVTGDGKVHWIVAFAPQGQVDVMGILPGKSRIVDMEADEWAALADGLLPVFAYFDRERFSSFNLSVFGSPEQTDAYSVHVHVVPRTTLGSLGTSDSNYFKVLHNETLSLKNPEEAARELRAVFRERG